MNKKSYQQPTMHIVMLQQTQMILAGSTVDKVESNADIGFGGGSDGTGPGTPHSRKGSGSVWDEDEDANW